MPFTFSHPALILPITKTNTRFSTTAIIIGSIVPDFEFFFQMREVPNIGHHILGFFVFDIPLAIIFCYLFHNVLRDPLIENLPTYFQKKCAKIYSFDWNAYASKNFFLFLSSLILGILSHLLIDEFTHHDGQLVVLLPILKTNIYLASKPFQVFYLLQIILSVFGLVSLFQIIVKSSNQTLSNHKIGRNNKWYWLIFAILFFGTLTLRIWFFPQYNNFWSLVMAFFGCLSYTWIITSILIKFSKIQ